MASAEDLHTYREQLQQVQAALSNEPENEGLKKLEEDLKEMIALATRLVHGSKGHARQETTGLSGVWKAGDACEAVWSKDGKYNKATIESISENGLTCTVKFDGYDTTESVKLSSLRSLDASEQDALKSESVRKHALEASATDSHAAKRNKNAEAERRKLKKEKLQKKQQEQAEVDKLHKEEQSKWKSFSSAGASKSKAFGPFTKKSIFATPDGPDGKVGHGTCGVGGKAMTDYAQRGKWHFDKEEK